MENIVKSRRGVYYDLTKSPYKINYCGATYVFSSKKKMEMFTKQANDCIRSLRKLHGKIYTIIGDKKDYDLTHLMDKAIYNCYHNMRYK